MVKAGRVQHWKHGWIPISPEAKAIASGRKTEVVKATVANQRLLDAEMTAQGIGPDHPMRGVLTRGRGNHLMVIRQRGKIAAGMALTIDRTYGNVDINELRVLDPAKRKGGIGTEMVRAAAREVDTNGRNPHAWLSVRGAVNSAKPFYVKTGATFTPDSDMGVWSPEALAALKAGQTPPPGIWHTPLTYFAETLAEHKRLYPQDYREKYGTLSPLAAAKKFGRFGDGGSTHGTGLTEAR